MRHVLVTGANRGIGLEMVRQLLARGERVTATARVPAAAEALGALLADHPDQLAVAALDVTDGSSIEGLVKRLGEATSIDVLVNNAGMLPRGERWGAVTAQALADAHAVNTAGPFLLTQAVAARLAPAAVVVNVSSILGSLAARDGFYTPSYCIAKAGLNMVTRLLAAELGATGKTVFSIHPGWVRTDMGGPDAEIAPVDAVGGILAVIDAAGPGHHGGFFDWQGKPVPW
jgi:NAD(P)-dependent dehydrogenase (short-subunit alcohol dehydrogenase family)